MRSGLNTGACVLALTLILTLNPTGSCVRLEELVLDSNEVRELPESLCALTSLRKISACQNRRVGDFRVLGVYQTETLNP